jgi:hypothetical protein
MRMIASDPESPRSKFCASCRRSRREEADDTPVFVLLPFTPQSECPHCGHDLTCCSVTHCRTGHSNLLCDGIQLTHSHQKCYACGWERITLRATT